MVAVMICLSVVTMVLLGVVSASVRYGRQARLDVQMEQTYWLLDAGIGKAIQEFERDPEMKDQSIAVDSELPGYTGSLDFEILEKLDDRVRLKVTAKLNRGTAVENVTQRSTVISIDIKKPNEQKDNS